MRATHRAADDDRPRPASDSLRPTWLAGLLSKVAPRTLLATILATGSLATVGVLQGGAALNLAQRVIGVATSLHVAPRSAWSCTTGTLFWESNGQLSTSQAPLHWTKVGTHGDPVDALAYSPQSRNLYAIDVKHGANYDKLVTISPNGTQNVLGAIAGLPNLYNWTGGDIDTSTGTYYLSDGVNSLYAVNLSTMSATRVMLPSTVTLGGDIIIQKGWLWTVSNAQVNGMSLTDHSTNLDHSRGRVN